MKEGNIMQNGAKTFRMEFRLSLIAAIIDSIAIICYLWLYYYFMNIGPLASTAWNHALATFCALMSGFNFSRSIRNWKKWNKERKEHVEKQEQTN